MQSFTQKHTCSWGQDQFKKSLETDLPNLVAVSWLKYINDRQPANAKMITPLLIGFNVKYFLNGYNMKIKQIPTVINTAPVNSTHFNT